MRNIIGMSTQCALPPCLRLVRPGARRGATEHLCLRQAGQVAEQTRPAINQPRVKLKQLCSGLKLFFCGREIADPAHSDDWKRSVPAQEPNDGRGTLSQRIAA